MSARCQVDVLVKLHIRELTRFLVSLLSLLCKEKQAPSMSTMSVCLLYVPILNELIDLHESWHEYLAIRGQCIIVLFINNCNIAAV
jgi:hypothetical protein